MRTCICVVGSVITAALLVTVAGARAQQAAKGEGKTYQTPQEVFNAAMTAAEKKDWKAFCECLTEDSRDGMAGALTLLYLATKDSLKKQLLKLESKDKSTKLSGKESLEEIKA